MLLGSLNISLKLIYFSFSLIPNILVGLVDGSSLFKRWYYEAEVEHVEACEGADEPPYLRVGWANSVGFKVNLMQGIK